VIIIIKTINLTCRKWSLQWHGTITESTDWTDHFAWRLGRTVHW